MSRRSKGIRWLAIPAGFALLVFFFVHFSIRLDGRPHTALTNLRTRPNSANPDDTEEDSILENLKKNIDYKKKQKAHAQEPTTVTVTIKETITFTPDSSPDSPLSGTSSRNRVNPKYKCDPYARNGYFDYGIKPRTKQLDDKSPEALQFAIAEEIQDLTYISYDPECPVTHPSISSRVQALDPSIAGISNKTVVLIGDQADRNLVQYFCEEFRGNYRVSAKDDSHIETLTLEELANRKKADTLPRRCYLPQYDFSLSSYFFYSVSSSENSPEEEAALWYDESDTPTSSAALKVFNMNIEAPFSWKIRLANTIKAVDTLHRHSPPDLIIVNFGLWDLLRFERLTLATKGSNGTPAARRKSLSSSQLAKYTERLDHFFQALREAYPDSRIVYRQTHYPSLSISSDSSESKRPDHTLRYNVFAPFKVHQISQVAKSVAAKWYIEYWNIGMLTRDIPKSDILQNGIYPTRQAALSIWGEGIFEYTIRVHQSTV